jgi:hypothetical protein
MSHTGFAFAIVNGKRFLKIAQFTVGLPMIAPGRAACTDSFLQNGFDGLGDEIRGRTPEFPNSR